MTDVNIERLKAMWRRSAMPVEPGAPGERFSRGWNAALEIACQDLDNEADIRRNEVSLRAERVATFADRNYTEAEERVMDGNR